MRNQLINALKNTKKDAQFHVYHFTPEGNYQSSKYPKVFVEQLLEENKEIHLHSSMKNVIMFGNIGVSLNSFEENIYYETYDTDGYLEYTSKYNPYYKIFIRLDKVNKTIEFKLGNKYKKMELIEEGWKGYVSKPFRQKYMKCVSADDLEKHIHDEFWNPRMVEIGRKALKIKSVLTKKQQKIA